MSLFKLANILVEDTEAFLAYPTLICRATAEFSCVQGDERNVWTLAGPGRFDFTTYFNALPTSKWREYTVAKDFHLHLELRGSACEVFRTSAGAFDYDSNVHDEGKLSVPASDEWVAWDLPITVGSEDVLNAFLIETDGIVEMRRACYCAEVDPKDVRIVELALATTTFKKEEFILKNIDLIKNQIIATDEAISGHFTLHVVDNGRTLDAHALEGPRVHIHPNPNVGGSGGFARGMIEAMEQQPRATHVLLMDDDVIVSAESIIRTFNLLSIVNDEYRDAFVSGAMMSLEEPYLRTEDLGFFTCTGNFRPLKPAENVSLLHGIVSGETYEAPTDLYPDTSQLYAGWWFCSIPVSTIEREGLPLPLFVRSDDAEYSLRCKPRFMTMSGICVWHAAFQFKYSAAVERYQVSRNTLICQFTTDMAPMSDFLREVRHVVHLDLKKYNYDDAELAVEGLEDFLRGPQFIETPVVEKRFMDANRQREQLMPYEELREKVAEYGVNLDDCTPGSIVLDAPRTRKQAILDLVSFNGQRLPEKRRKGARAAIVEAAGWVYQAGKMHGADTIIAIDVTSRRGTIRHLDKKRFWEVWKRYKRAVRAYKKNEKRLRREYAAARERLTSIPFWKQYLGIE